MVPSVLRTIYRRRSIIFAMARRELFAPHRNQVFGKFWVFWNPLFFSILITVVFNFVFGAKFGGTKDLPRDYPTYVLSGMLAWQAFSQILVRSPGEAVANTNLIRQVVFPVEAIPAASVLTSIFPAFCGQLFLLLYSGLYRGDLPATAVFLPLLWCLQLLWMLGISYAFFCFGAFFKDLRDISATVATAGIYLLPIIYVPTAVPKPLRGVVRYNPFGSILRCFQDILYFGQIRSVWAWVMTVVYSVSFYLLGSIVFRRLRGQLGTVL
jgi:lipopolysaccharide transport system permease protein